MGPFFSKQSHVQSLLYIKPQRKLLHIFKEKMQHIRQNWGYIIDSIHFTFFNYPCEIGVIALTTNKYCKELEYQNDTPKKPISNK